MDVFGFAVSAGGELLRDAALAAGHELGVFAALATAHDAEASITAAAARGSEPILGAARRGDRGATLDELAAVLEIRGKRHRLRALLDVLAAIGALERVGDRYRATGTDVPRPVVPRAGWGLAADVIRRDKPLAPEGGEVERRFHHHLTIAGAAAAREIAPLLPGPLLDLGAGAGTYTAAVLERDPLATATVVDFGDVLELAADHLARFGDRVRFVNGDASVAPVGTGYGAVLLANLLHLHSPAICAKLVAAAARAVAPGGVVAIKDLVVAEDRSGPLSGLLFALNMALYTGEGDLYPASQLHAWLAAAGLVDIEARSLTSAPDSIVVLARKPREASDEASGEVSDTVSNDASAGASHAMAHATNEATGEGIATAIERAGRAAWEVLRREGAVHPSCAASEPPVLEPPASFVRALGRARADAGTAAAELEQHYVRRMPAMWVRQLCSVDEPAATLFHARLDWTRLPRMARAIDRLFAVLAAADVDAAAVLGAATADAFRDRTDTLAALYRRTHYGAYMPMLYGYPADLAYVASRGLDTLAAIDRYLTAPVVHELCHFGRDRDAIEPLHLDECIGGWLGVYVDPEFAYPLGHDGAIYAAPWLAQVGQAFARAFGVDAIVRAHTGAVTWSSVLPAELLAAAARLGRDDWCARRPLHLLADTLAPEPWIALAYAACARRPLDGVTLADLASLPPASFAGALPDDRAFDRAMVGDALRAMCLDNVHLDGSLRTFAGVPATPITLDATRGFVTTARRGSVDTVAPRYALPPDICARLLAAGITAYELELSELDALDPLADLVAAAALPA